MKKQNWNYATLQVRYISGVRKSSLLPSSQYVSATPLMRSGIKTEAISTSTDAKPTVFLAFSILPEAWPY